VTCNKSNLQLKYIDSDINTSHLGNKKKGKKYSYYSLFFSFLDDIIISFRPSSILGSLQHTLFFYFTLYCSLFTVSDIVTIKNTTPRHPFSQLSKNYKTLAKLKIPLFLDPILVNNNTAVECTLTLLPFQYLVLPESLVEHMQFYTQDVVYLDDSQTRLGEVPVMI
jgi:hypothetical protein